MREMSREVLAKTAFVVSLAVLSGIYGWVSRTAGWFPNDLLGSAWRQGAREVTRWTGPPDYTNPRVHRRQGVRVERPEAVQPGLTLLVSTWEEFGWEPGLKLIDRDGNTLHRWKVRPEELFTEDQHRRGSSLAEQDVQGSHLFPNGDVLVNVEYAGTARLDACGEVQWTFPGGSHHSIDRADDGSFWIPAVTGLRRPASQNFPDGYPGLDGPIYQDHLVQLSAEGDLLSSINVLDVLYANGLHRHIPKNRQQDRRDVVHLNDVEALPAARAEEYPTFEAGDLLVSLRNLDLVLVMDPASGEVRWHSSHHFIHQHDPDFVGPGWIGVFDNNWDGTPRGEMAGGSRIVGLRPQTGATGLMFQSSGSTRFYSARRGKWQHLQNGNHLLTESDAGRVLEVDQEGRTVWEWVAPPYSESRVPSVTKGERVSITPGEVASWPCSGAGSRNGWE